jgi:hypothetical protein
MENISMTIPHDPSSDKLSLTVQANGKTFTVKGQVARSLQALIKRGPTGITALELSTWALRLAAYIHTLRRQHKLSILTLTEKHPGGTHGRYVLRTPVSIVKKSG